MGWEGRELLRLILCHLLPKREAPEGGGQAYRRRRGIDLSGEGIVLKWNSWKNIFVPALALALLCGAVTVQRGRGDPKAVWAPARLPQRQLILDAGHGGEDGGAVSITGVAESTINLAIVRKLDHLLGFCGVAPILLREEDISLHDPSAATLREKKVSDLHNRVATIEGTQGALVVSIHQNSFPNPAYHGAQVFFREEGESKALADLVQESLRRGLDPNNKRTATKIPDTVYLMKHITCPAILVECGFLTNAGEEVRLRSGEYQAQIALCVASAVLNTCGNCDIIR